MKRLAWIALAAIFGFILLNSGCCDRGSKPGPPYGHPDDTSNFNSGDYQSIDYTYYCYGGQYISVSYASTEKCDDWHKVSDYRSDGICDYSLRRQIPAGTQDQLRFLRAQGFPVDTVLFDSGDRGPGSIVAP